jgi:hypothetical protein
VGDFRDAQARWKHRLGTSCIVESAETVLCAWRKLRASPVPRFLVLSGALPAADRRLLLTRLNAEPRFASVSILVARRALGASVPRIPASSFLAGEPVGEPFASSNPTPNVRSRRA